jgi:hypothetical protein
MVVTSKFRATASSSDAVVDSYILGPPVGGRNLQAVTAGVRRRLTLDLRQPRT